MYLKLFILSVILTLTYGLPKDVKDSTDRSKSLDSKEKEKTNKGCKIANCDVCNVNKKICISCSVGWGRNAVGTCSACWANCNLCSLDFKVCTECSAPTVYKLIGGQCKKCEFSNCQTCNDDLTKCNVCVARYGLNIDNKCQACEENCVLCSLNFKDCTECLNPSVYTLIGGQCRICELSNCQTCNNDLTKCNDCVVGYGLDMDYKCQACIDTNCEFCKSDYKKCEICKVDFEINSNGNCFQRGRGQCQLNNKRYCLNELGIDPFNPFICKKCAVSNCFYCNDDYQVCNHCKEGFRLDANNKCIECAITNCSTCLKDEKNCDVCKSSFGLVENQCIVIVENCRSYDNISENCFVCNNNYYMSRTQQCIEMSSSNCVYAYNSACASCIAGFTLKNLTCNKCIVKNCAICKNLSDCQLCMAGFYFEENTCKEYCFNCNELSTNMTCNHATPGYGDYFGLKDDCKIKYCKYCFFNPDMCEVCQDGFALVDFQCIKLE